jgi:uncharacterized protein
MQQPFSSVHRISDGRSTEAVLNTSVGLLRAETEAAALPRTARDELSYRSQSENRGTIWIDLENTPHVPFFNPIIKELRMRGYKVALSARRAFQTCEMATKYGFVFTKVGHHYGQRRLYKIWGLLVRSLQLVPLIIRERPILALNHGSRSQNLIGNLLRIPTVMIMDYEHCTFPPFVRPRWEIVPDALAKGNAHCRTKARIRTFTGIKEDVYVPNFNPDSSIVQELGLNHDIIVTVRPPATEALYHCKDSEVLFVRFMERACCTINVKIVLLPRNETQKRQILSEHVEWFRKSRTIIPNHVVDGLNLLWHSDLAVSGGGTMNREAAALGIPVYSIFRGKLGAVDQKLEREQRLTIIRSPEEADAKILLHRRDKTKLPSEHSRTALRDIVSHIEDMIQLEYKQTSVTPRASPRRYTLRLADPRVRCKAS